MALNQVDCSPAMIHGLWRDIRREIGIAPAPEPEYSDPATQAGSAAVIAITGKAIALPLYAFSRRRLPHWKITWQECSELGSVWGAVIDWLFPGEGLRGFMRWIENLLGRYGPLLDALKSTGRIVGDRVMNTEKYLPAPTPENDESAPRTKVARGGEIEKRPVSVAPTKNQQIASLQE